MNISELEKTLKRKKPHKIFPFDGTESLPMTGRIKHGMKSKCFFCKADILDPTFKAGFKTGHKNVLMHESCYNEEYMLYVSLVLDRFYKTPLKDDK